MNKKLITEISRIHKLMGINESGESTSNRWCPFCDAVLKQVDELVNAYNLKNVPAREINLKINDLLEKIKNNTDLTINERAALTQAIENLKKSGDEMGDVAKYAERARTEIRGKTDVLSEIPVTKITYNYTDELYSTKEFADDFVEYEGVDHIGITNAYESEFEINGSFYQEKYATFDEWFDEDFKIQLDTLLQNKGYTNKTFRDNVIENMRNRFKNNSKITSIFDSKIKDYVFLTKSEKDNIELILSKKIDDTNFDEVRDEINFEIIKLDNTKDTWPGDFKEIEEDIIELIKKLRKKEKEAIDLKMEKSGSNFINNPEKPISGLNTDGTVDTNLKMADWIWERWWRGDEEDYFGGSKVVYELENKAAKLENIEFNPKDVKVTNKTVDNSGRDFYELELPTGEKVLLYSSTGTGAKEYKQYGDWQVVNGFGRHPNNPEFFWVVKTAETTKLTKGKNKYLTDMSNYLKQNGDKPDLILGK